MTEVKTNARGRKPFDFANKKAVAVVLLQVKNGEDLSLHYRRLFEEQGFIQHEKGEKVVQGRGRRPYVWGLTKKGKQLAQAAISFKWFPEKETV